jgi:hypothetical protein
VEIISWKRRAHNSQLTTHTPPAPTQTTFSLPIMMNSSTVRFLAVALSFFVAQAVTQIGNDSHLRSRSQTPSLASIPQIDNDSNLRGNDHAPTTMASVMQIENFSHLRGGSQSSTSVSPQSHVDKSMGTSMWAELGARLVAHRGNSSPRLRIRDTNTTTGPALYLATNSRLRRTAEL